MIDNQKGGVSFLLHVSFSDECCIVSCDLYLRTNDVKGVRVELEIPHPSADERTYVKQACTPFGISTSTQHYSYHCKLRLTLVVISIDHYEQLIPATASRLPFEYPHHYTQRNVQQFEHCS